MPPITLLRGAAVAAVLLVAGDRVESQQAASLEPPDLSATDVSLSLTLGGADTAPRRFTMGGKGGCQNLGDDKRPNWVVGWSAADGSQLFTLTVQGLPNGKTEERMVLQASGESRVVLTSVAAARIDQKGAGVRFRFDGVASGGRTLKGTVRCAGQTT
jgi:hypothetical protein